VGASLSTDRLDPETGAVLATSEIGTGNGGTVHAREGGVWVRSADRFLVRLDADGEPIEGSPRPTPRAGVTSSRRSTPSG